MRVHLSTIAKKNGALRVAGRSPRAPAFGQHGRARAKRSAFARARWSALRRHSLVAVVASLLLASSLSARCDVLPREQRQPALRRRHGPRDRGHQYGVREDDPRGHAQSAVRHRARHPGSVSTRSPDRVAMSPLLSSTISASADVLEAPTARMVKVVDTRDLKSLGLNRPCRFESGSGHQTSRCPAAIRQRAQLETRAWH